MHRKLVSLLMGILLSLLNSTYVWATDSNIGESSSNEIKFCSGLVTPYLSCTAVDLRAQADALATPVAIFEYVRNNYDYSLYHGARSGSINTFLGSRGNDVDLAATLIAMLRSQGIPARYAVATVRVPAAQAMNLLAVENADLSYALLRDMGIQRAVLAADKSTIDFEHVWVEALVPYASYRGTGTQTVSCVTTPAACNWVPLDPSFKQHVSRHNGLDPYTSLTSSLPPFNGGFFDYTDYYNAILNNDATRLNKNPIEIYQEQVLAWLRTNAPGKTLDDIPDFTDIVAEQDGLLPDSLPYVIAPGSTIRRYNSAADHDAVVPATEPKKWMKYVTAQAVLGGGVLVTSATASLVDASTQQFTLTYDTSSGIRQYFRLGGTQIGGAINVGGSLIINGVTVAVGYPFQIVVTMDGSPAPDSTSTDQTITASYNAAIGGYYLVATGGETSNWSQVHRAAKQLLAANQQYKIVFNPSEVGCVPSSGLNCSPYVDLTGNGWDSSDPLLLNNNAAMDALTGGLLYVSANQYFAQLKDNLKIADNLNRIKTPISGFLGVVSSTFQAEYIAGTAFSILPGGLLIDMKGINVSGSWRIDQPATISNNQFAFVGHIVSSLEHETWQELTGYDAVSTVRGMQIALANGATLVNPKKNSTTDTMAAAYTAFGFSSGAAPTGFTYKPYNLFGTQPATWTNATNGAAFDVLLSQETTATPALQQSRANYVYSTGGGLYGWVNCVNSQAAQLLNYINTGYGAYSFTSAYIFCDGTSYATTYTINQIYAALQTDYKNTVIPTYIGQNYFNYFDAVQGFVPASYVYRATPIAGDAQFTTFVQNIRDNLYLQTLTQNWVEYLLPSKQSVGPNYKFAVDIRKVYDTPSGNLLMATFAILNNTGIAAGGGYVGSTPLTASYPLPAAKKD